MYRDNMIYKKKTASNKYGKRNPVSVAGLFFRSGSASPYALKIAVPNPDIPKRKQRQQSEQFLTKASVQKNTLKKDFSQNENRTYGFGHGRSFRPA